MKYRPEIDGLRALAVIAVILFHAGFKFISGGFVGVDIFFVISGFLITTILIQDIEDKRMSLAHFYERRARRILPALFFVMICCLPFAWMWMLPSQIENFSQSLIASSLFVSNIFFSKQGGYFSAPTEEMPLHHIWSLAVEEQFYIIFPLFFILFWRFGKKRPFWIIVFIATLSLLLSEWGTTNFYFTHTRVWELLAGSVSAFIAQKHGIGKNNLLASLGFIAIFFSFFYFDNKTPFPSFYTLIPITGTALIILFAHEKTFIAKFLNHRLLVGIGLISYSAYLWHQPIFAFAKIRFPSELTPVRMALLSIFSIVLASLSWKFVEQPFRKAEGVFKKRKTIFMVSLVAIIIMCLLGFYGISKKGLIKEYSPRVIEILNFAKAINGQSEREFWGANDSCYLIQGESEQFKMNGCLNMKYANRPSVMLIGESHAGYLSLALKPWLEDYQVNLIQISASHCAPLGKATDNRCKEIHELIFDTAKKMRPNIIIEFHTVSSESYSDSKLSYLSEYSKNLIKLKTLSDKVLILGQIPGYRPSLSQLYVTHGLEEKLESLPLRLVDPPTIHSEQERRKTINELGSKIEYVSFFDYLCDQESCRVLVGPVLPEGLIVWDYGHLSKSGAEYVLEGLLYPRIQDLLLKKPSK